MSRGGVWSGILRFQPIASYSSDAANDKKLGKGLGPYTGLREEDIVKEKFIRGSGPGGQKINKTSNCVQLFHVSGITVTCQETRFTPTSCLNILASFYIITSCYAEI